MHHVPCLLGPSTGNEDPNFVLLWQLRLAGYWFRLLHAFLTSSSTWWLLDENDYLKEWNRTFMWEFIRKRFHISQMSIFLSLIQLFWQLKDWFKPSVLLRFRYCTRAARMYLVNKPKTQLTCRLLFHCSLIQCDATSAKLLLDSAYSENFSFHSVTGRK